MRITVFGASGRVGSRVVELALRRGYLVSAFVHHHDLFVPSNNMLVIKGDVYTASEVATALRGSEAVISCVSSWGTPKKDVLTSAMQAIIPAMEAAKISRLVTLTGSGAAMSEEQPSVSHRMLAGLLAPTSVGKVFRDAETHLHLLAISSLDWTTIRSPIMNNLGSSTYRLSLEPNSALSTISRNGVATALLDQLESDKFLGQAPFIHR